MNPQNTRHKRLPVLKRYAPNTMRPRSSLPLTLKKPKPSSLLAEWPSQRLNKRAHCYSRTLAFRCLGSETLSAVWNRSHRIATCSSLFLLTLETAILIRCWSLTLQMRSEEHTSELQSRFDLVCRLLLE